MEGSIYSFVIIGKTKSCHFLQGALSLTKLRTAALQACSNDLFSIVVIGKFSNVSS